MTVQDLRVALVVFLDLLLVLILIVLGIGVRELWKPEREARRKLGQLRERGETEATLTLVLTVDLEEGEVYLKDTSVEWKQEVSRNEWKQAESNNEPKQEDSNRVGDLQEAMNRGFDQSEPTPTKLSLHKELRRPYKFEPTATELWLDEIIERLDEQLADDANSARPKFEDAFPLRK